MFSNRPARVSALRLARGKSGSPRRSRHLCQLAVSAQFPRNLVRNFEKTASERFRESASADATDCMQGEGLTYRVEAVRAPLRFTLPADNVVFLMSPLTCIWCCGVRLLRAHFRSRNRLPAPVARFVRANLVLRRARGLICHDSAISRRRVRNDNSFLIPVPPPVDFKGPHSVTGSLCEFLRRIEPQPFRLTRTGTEKDLVSC